MDANDLAGGVILDDFDNDGLLDVMISAWDEHGPLRYFHNQGDGTSVERTSEAGLDDDGVTTIESLTKSA